MAVQIAKHFGAYVIGVSSAKNRNFVLSSGADEHIDYTTENFRDKLQNIDVVIDTIQGETLQDSVDVVRRHGIIVTLPSPEIPEEVKTKAEQKKVNIEFMMVESHTKTIREISDLLKKTILKPAVYKTFSFEDIRNAHLEVETNHVVGKVIVNI